MDSRYEGQGNNRLSKPSPRPHMYSLTVGENAANVDGQVLWTYEMQNATERVDNQCPILIQCMPRLVNICQNEVL